MNIRAILGVLDFFIPVDVVLAVMLVFAMENIVETLIGGNPGLAVWVALYVLGILVLSASNYLSADEEELEDLNEDLEDLSD